MSRAFIIASAVLPFRDYSAKTHRDLATEVFEATVADTDPTIAEQLGSIHFGSCFSDHWGQSIIRGQACLTPLIRNRRIAPATPIINVEAACATGTLALRGAMCEVLSGNSHFAMAMGVEKLIDPFDHTGLVDKFAGGSAPFDSREIRADYKACAESFGGRFQPDGPYTLPMATYALQAQHHMHQYGMTQNTLALVAMKNITNARGNPIAYRSRDLGVEEILEDKPVTYPLTRAMCSPMTDGASAAIVCSEKALLQLAPQYRERAVEILSIGLAGGSFRTINSPSLSRRAAERAYKGAGLTPEHINFAEVHDATAFSEIFQCEMLGFCNDGEGASLLEQNATTPEGPRPVNASGGLIGKGHPIAATGLAMIGELVQQIRREAGSRQLAVTDIGLAENGGGVLGLEEAITAVTLLANKRS